MLNKITSVQVSGSAAPQPEDDAIFVVEVYSWLLSDRVLCLGGLVPYLLSQFLGVHFKTW